jgi:hypothetical protein
VGSTDSELAFCWLMQELAKAHASVPSIDELTRTLAELLPQPAAHGTFNVLLSNGQALWAHCSTQLHWLERAHPFGAARLADEDLSVDFGPLTTPGDRVALVATQPLTSATVSSAGLRGRACRASRATGPGAAVGVFAEQGAGAGARGAGRRRGVCRPALGHGTHPAAGAAGRAGAGPGSPGSATPAARQAAEAQVAPAAGPDPAALHLQHAVGRAALGRHGRPRGPALLRSLTAFLRGSTELLGRDATTWARRLPMVGHYLAIMQAAWARGCAAGSTMARPNWRLQPHAAGTFADPGGERHRARRVAVAAVRGQVHARRELERLDAERRGDDRRRHCPPPGSEGVGLANCRQRLHTRFGEPARPGRGVSAMRTGTRARITMPRSPQAVTRERIDWSQLWYPGPTRRFTDAELARAGR